MTPATHEAKLAQLQQLHRRATRYEVVAEVAGQKYLIGYLLNRSKGRLLHAVIDNEAIRARLVALAGAGDNTPAKYSRARGWEFVGAYSLLRIGPSGRTQREAICEGELPALAMLATD